MATSEDQIVEEILQKLQRDINCLSDDNKTTRRRALERLKRETVGQTPCLSPVVLQQVLVGGLLKPLLKMFSDPVEKCRELAITIISEFMTNVDDHTPFLPLIVPIIVARLGTQDITEPSEEIRLILVCLVTSLVNLSGCGLAPYLHDMVTILRYTLVDPYPEVKKESCSCTVKLASAIPQVFNQESEIIVKSLLHSVGHQHSKVRIASVKALGAAIQYGSASPINDSLPSLAQRICDSSPSVRWCTISVIGGWLIDLPDRYSYHHKLLPLLLTGLTDEVDEIRHKTHDLWTQIGTKYEEENENDLKDKMDFAQLSDPFPGLEYPRPQLGCRVLVYRNFSKILPAILRDLFDWTVNSRIKSSQLLHTLSYHLEDNMTHHIQPVLSGLYKACQDEEKVVCDWAYRTAQIIGFYVPVEVWCHLVLPAVKVSAGCPSVKGDGSSVAVGPVQCTSCLIVLHGLIEGSCDENLQSHLQTITQTLAQPEVGQTLHLPLLKQLISCVEALVKSSSTTSFLISLSLPLFTILLRVLATVHYDTLEEDVHRVMMSLVKAQNLESIHELYAIHSQDILEKLKGDYSSWTLHSPNCALFASYLGSKEIGPAMGGVMKDIITIIGYCIHPDQDPEMRLKFISLLIQRILDPSIASTSTSMSQLQQCSPELVSNVLMPCCVWRAGRTAAAIRTAALTGVQALLHAGFLTALSLNSLLPDLLPQVVSCLDDDNSSTRLVSCKILRLLFQSAPQNFKVDQLHQLYSDLFKRLDDNSNEIRHEMIQTLIAYFKMFPSNYDSVLYKAHLEVMYNSLLVHLDDPSENIQSSMLAVLHCASSLNPQLLQTMIENVRNKHRTTKYCDELVALLSQ